ncbi:zf-HC2 domain-containing protein [Streptomyces sp. AHU1]|uniref:zf-HC2 domain-containing protein n=1 Tax=Streptomyces sp. AHU1 TaxID=3377215 RepID=UPI00387802A8
MTGWHAPDDLVTRYADGSLAETDAWSLEKHLERCGRCAARVSHAVRAGAAGPALTEVRDAVLAAVLDMPPAAAPVPATRSGTDRAAVPTAPAARARTTPAALPAAPSAQAHASPAAIAPAGPASAAAAVPVRTPAAAARTPRASGGRLTRILWAAGPAVRGTWTGAVLLVALGAVALAYGGGWAGARPLLLALAPVVPVAGVALSYGRHADPLHEIAASAPSGGLRLLLTRTAAVLVVSAPSLTVAGLLLPSSGPRLPAGPATAGWLLPGLALTLASLVLSGYLGCRTATAVVGGGWLLAVSAPLLASAGTGLTAGLTEQLSLYFTGAPSQGGWAAATVLCALLLAARRTAYDRLETM